MNLVIDDAIEVKQTTKPDPEEKRRELGSGSPVTRPFGISLTYFYRSNTIEGGQRVTYPISTMTLSS